MSIKYTTLHYLIAMLKAYGIKYIVASPGGRNAIFCSMVQERKDFICKSVFDERSAGYVGLGISREIGEPVVISCTGATASRNYLSALTEAYYSKTPVIALTFNPYFNNPYNLAAQYVDRSVSQNDIKAVSVDLPQIKDEEDKVRFLTLLNVALSTAKFKNMPVHINCPSTPNFTDETSLPEDIWTTNFYRSHFEAEKKNLAEKKFAVFIGQHKKFSEEEQETISNFAKSWAIPVLCDHTSNYNGENKILISQYVSMLRYHNDIQLIIDMGNITGEYSHEKIYNNAEVWRITEDGDFRCRNSKPVTKTFYCEEQYFFSLMSNNNNVINVKLYDEIKNKIDNLKFPDLPLCNALICQNLAKFLPKNSVLHVSILNSLRNMNFFKFDESIDISCNVGGFGIDGAVSTLVGQSLVDSKKKYYGLIGDLAFFYDMNIIGNRDITNNLRIILVNNAKGIEFRLNPGLESNLKEKTDNLIAAAGHNKGGAKGWAESCGFKYMSAKNKEEFLNQIKTFCDEECDKPILFEVFTTTEDEQNGLNLMQNINKDRFEEGLIQCYKTVRNLIK